MFYDVRCQLIGRISNGVPENLEISVGDTPLFDFDEDDFTGIVTPIYNTNEFECDKVTVHTDDGGNFVGISFGKLIPKQATE